MQTHGDRATAISVVVTNHNYAAYLGAALDSIYSGTYSPTEVIVVDDGSTDDSLRVLDRYSDVQIICLDGRGQTAAMNAGCELATGDSIVFLDADDVLFPGALARLAAAISGGGVSVVHGPVLEIDESGRSLGRMRPRSRLPSGDLAARVTEHGPATYEPPPTSGNAWRRSFLEQVMPLPEIEPHLRRGSAHADLFLSDLAVYFGRVAAIEGPVAGYRMHGSNDFASNSEGARFDRDVWCYEERCRRLSEFLTRRGEEHDIDRWHRGSWVRMVASAFQVIDASIGHESSFVLIDEDQLPKLAPARAIPFMSCDGRYTGPPASDAEGIAALEALRASGVDTVVIAWTARWWLDYYAALAQHLYDRWRLVTMTEQVQIFRA